MDPLAGGLLLLEDEGLVMFLQEEIPKNMSRILFFDLLLFHFHALPSVPFSLYIVGQVNFSSLLFELSKRSCPSDFFEQTLSLTIKVLMQSSLCVDSTCLRVSITCSFWSLGETNQIITKSYIFQ